MSSVHFIRADAQCTSSELNAVEMKNLLIQACHTRPQIFRIRCRSRRGRGLRLQEVSSHQAATASGFRRFQLHDAYAVEDVGPVSSLP